MRLPLGIHAYDRSYAKQPEIKLVNRFFERNPTNLADGVSLLSRPPTKKLFEATGEGRPRAQFAQEGTFNGDNFVVFGSKLFRRTKGGRTVEVNGFIDLGGDVDVDATADRVWFADGTRLQFYDGNGNAATGALTLTANAANDETVTIGARTYTYKTTLTGAADEVLIGVDEIDSLDNLIAAINDDITAEGVLYGTGTVKHPDVTASAGSGSVMDVTAVAEGAAFNSVATTETLSNGSWGAATLTGGTNSVLNVVAPPSTEAFVSVAILAQHVIVVVANSQKWFYIPPGETTIDALDFYEAEQIPDEIISARTVGDFVAFFGSKSTEFWYANGAGDPDDPFSYSQGAAFSRGILEGTDVLVKEELFVVGDDEIVYRTGGGPQPISTPFISQKIREARTLERNA